MEGFREENHDFEMEINLKEYFALFKQWAWLIFLAAIVAGMAAFLISRQITPVYRATATVLVNEAPVTRTSGESLVASDRLTRTYSEMMANTPVILETINRLGLTISPQQLRDMITIKTVPSTLLIDVEVESIDPLAATLIANTLVDVFAAEVENVQASRYEQSKQSLENKLAEVEEEINLYTELANAADSEIDRVEYISRASQLRETYYSLLQLYENVWISEAQTISSISLTEPAFQPTDPVRPRVMINTALAAMVGFLLAGGVLVAREALDDTLHTPEDIKKHLNLPVLGAIESFEADNGQRLIAALQPRSPVTEGFRALRENIRFSSVDRPLHTLMVTSPEPAEGKTTMTANLALVFAQAGIDTILIDCDMRRPMVHNYFEVSGRYGISTMLFDDDWTLEKRVLQTPYNQLRLIPSGKLPPNPAELLASEKMKMLLEKLKQEAQLIIIDTPPIMAVTDAASLAPVVDGVLLVVRPGTTHIMAAKQSLEQLHRAHARVLGVVLNPLDLKRSRYAYRFAYKNGRGSYHQYYHEGQITSETGITAPDKS